MVKRCYKCKEEKQLEAFSKNQTKCKSCTKAYREANQEMIAAQKRAWYESNLERCRAKYEAERGKYQARYKENREKISKRNQAWQKSNHDKKNAITAKRRARKLKAIPEWMTKRDFAAIEEWYRIAKDLQWLSEEPLQVDHIIPLQGKEVCGLHVPWNLQVLPASENFSKGNRITDFMLKYDEIDFKKEVIGG